MMPDMKEERYQILAIVFLLSIFSAGLLINYFNIYAIVFGLNSFEKFTAVILFFVMASSLIVATTPLTLPLVIRVMFGTIFLVFFSMWDVIFSSLPVYAPYSLGALMIAIMLFNKGYRNSRKD